MEVRTISERRRKEIASLGRKKGRLQHEQALIEGLRGVTSAVEGKAPIVEIVATDKLLENKAIYDLIVRAQVPVYRVSARDAGRISSVENNQGILAVVSIKHVPLAEIMTSRRILVLDGVQDPGNVGTMIRTAAWFGIEAIVGGAGTADFYNPKVTRASMGGLWDLNVVRTESLNEALSACREAGFQIYGADLDGLAVNEWLPANKSLLVMGSEANGLSESVHALLDQKIAIKGTKGTIATESLNVATAAGILMHHWSLQG